MPLPQTDIDWPPKSVLAANEIYKKWAAWWSGNLEQLAEVYQGHNGYGSGTGLILPNDSRPAMTQQRPRSFHGTPGSPGQLRSAKLHVPLAADIASTSADMLFSDPPKLVVAQDAGRRSKAPGPPSATQQRLDELMDTAGFHSVLLEAGEIASAFGGVYLRLGWDEAVADHVLLDAIAPDAAIPEFRSGQLTAVTFWRVLARLEDDGQLWRHLERHERGHILHGLYMSGDSTKLGKAVPLIRHPETEAFATLVGKAGSVETGADGLSAYYVANMKPNRTLRASQLGRSDYDGVEPVLDALDEAWTSWLRDLRLGKARMMVPEVYLANQGRGRGALFDSEQEIYEQLNHLPGGDQLAIEQVQFAIRVVEHQATTAALMSQVVRGAGYSEQTFGATGDVAATATEVTARQARSYTTRSKKINYWRPVLGKLMLTALQIEVAKFKGRNLEPVVPDIEWPDGVSVDPMALAQSLQLLEGARAVSTRTKVMMLHEDWDELRVAEEVKLIHAEGAPPADPMAPPGSAPAAVGSGTGGSRAVGVTGNPVAGSAASVRPPRPGRPAGPAGKARTPRPAVARRQP